MMTTRQRLNPQIRGFWSDVFSEGEDKARQILGNVLGDIEKQVSPTPKPPVYGSGADLMTEQNRIVNVTFRGILDRYDGGQLSATSAAQAIRDAAIAFQRFALTQGERGRQGAADVTTLANQIISGFHVDVAPLSSTTPAAASGGIPSWVFYLGGGFIAAKLLRLI